MTNMFLQNWDAPSCLTFWLLLTHNESIIYLLINIFYSNGTLLMKSFQIKALLNKDFSLSMLIVIQI